MRSRQPTSLWRQAFGSAVPLLSCARKRVLRTLGLIDAVPVRARRINPGHGEPTTTDCERCRDDAQRAERRWAQLEQPHLRHGAQVPWRHEPVA
mgnify:CR=1 FL=1